MSRTLKIRRRVLRPAVAVLQHLPEFMFSRAIQFVVDAGLSTLALFLAYQLRFDAAVPAHYRSTMYLWMAVLAVLRPTMLWANGAYRLTWRYFTFRDALLVGFGAALASLILLTFRLIFTNWLLMANPISVIVIEGATYLLLACGLRAFRRLLGEEAVLSTDKATRLLLVGTEQALPAALHQVVAHPNLEIAGLLVPTANGLRGMRICGCPVLGDPSALNGLLQRRVADLVMLTEAKLDCMGDVVAMATQHGVEVRLLPSAGDVIRGDISVSAPRRVSRHVERVLVLGGAGYVGSALVPMLLERCYKVRVLDRLLFGAESLDAVAGHPNFDLAVGDVRDIESVVAAIKQCDAIIHLAGLVGDPACAVNKELSLEINRAATRMIIDICKGYGVGRFVFASTCSVYGASDYLVDELTPPAPISVYAETKVDSERLLLDAASGRFQPVILRLGTLFGLSPRPRFDLVLNLLTARAASRGRITVFNGEQWRPFLHVCDAARAFLLALEASPDVAAGEIFNVGDYRLNLRLGEVSRKIAALVPSVQIEHAENADKRNYRASFDKIHTRLGFVCDKGLEFGIREIFEAVASQRIPDFTAPRFNNQMVTQLFAESASAQESSMRVLAKLAA